MAPYSILVLTPHAVDASLLCTHLTHEGWEVCWVQDLQEALVAWSSKVWACALIVDDVQHELFREFMIKRQDDSLVRAPVVVFVQKGDVPAVVEAMRLGALSVCELTPDGALPDALQVMEMLPDYTIHKAVCRGAKDARDPRRVFVHAPDSPVAPILEILPQIAHSDASVLITGESGTGKDLLARIIHDLGPRQNAPFVSVNCGAIPLELMESELFGHTMGAFTGAVADKLGSFEAAHGGTIFLDEIADMPVHVQVKLLRVLQDKVVMRLGSTESISLNFRVIAATHQNVDERIASGVFRQDLYYRLSVLPIHIPALRHRIMDLEPLMKVLIEQKNKEHGAYILGFSTQARRLLRAHTWPGNVREFENLIERLSVLKRGGYIQTEDLPKSFLVQPPAVNLGLDVPSEGIDMTQTLEHLERKLLTRALNKASGNKARAARLLGLNRTTFVEKLKRRSIDPHSSDS